MHVNVGLGVEWSACGPSGARCCILRQTQPWFTLKSWNWQIFRYCVSCLCFFDGDWQLLPSSLQPRPALLAVFSAVTCLLVPGKVEACCSTLREPALPGLTAALADMLPQGLGRPFQSTNNTGEFRLIGSASLRQRGKKVSYKRKD